MCPETDILEQEKKTVADMIAIRPIDEENAVFERTEGGFVRLRYTDPDGSVREFPRVSIHRCFPFSDPDHYISVREPEADGREIGLIEDIGRLPDDTRQMLEEQMALRYFTPVILRIHSIKEENGFSYWDTETDRGACRFTVRMGGGNVYPIGKDRYLINDLDGNRFEIPDLGRMTARELKMLDLFV